jgi:RNA-directed DNA polymerase
MIDIESVVKDWETFFRNRVRGRRDLVDGYIRYVRALLSADLPPIFELHHLSALTATEQYKLAGYVMNANAFYRSFSVPKRRGGSRKIDVPVPELLRVQKWISNNILAKVPVSAAAHGFIRGRSIITNASVHVGQPMMLKMDLSSFFPSISYKRGLAVFLRMGYPANVSFFLSSLCFKDGYLPQGSAAKQPYSACRTDAAFGAPC